MINYIFDDNSPPKMFKRQKTSACGFQLACSDFQLQPQHAENEC